MGPLDGLINLLSQLRPRTPTANPLMALLQAVVDSPAQRGRAFQGIRDTNRQGIDDQLNRRAWTAVRQSGNTVSPQQALAKEQAKQQVQEMATVAGVSMAQPWARSGAGPSIEEMSNLAGGWKQPGLKSQFDLALLTKDLPSIKQLIPKVPEKYLTQGFGPKAYEIALEGARKTGAPNAMQKVTQSMSRGVKSVGQAATPDSGVLSQVGSWFLK